MARELWWNRAKETFIATFPDETVDRVLTTPDRSEKFACDFISKMKLKNLANMSDVLRAIVTMRKLKEIPKTGVRTRTPALPQKIGMAIQSAFLNYYARRSVDNLLVDPEEARNFVERIRKEIDGASALQDFQILRDLVGRRKRGAKKGGLPRRVRNLGK